MLAFGLAFLPLASRMPTRERAAGKVCILRPVDNRLKCGFGCGNLFALMSLAELKDNVMALPESERHEFVVWLNRLEQDYGDIPGEALAEMAAEVWDQDDRHAPPTHPAR